MLTHVGFRPLWPVVLFLPWLAVGVASLLWSMRRSSHSGSRAHR